MISPGLWLAQQPTSACAGAAGIHGLGALPTTRGADAGQRPKEQTLWGLCPVPWAVPVPRCKTACPCRTRDSMGALAAAGWAHTVKRLQVPGSRGPWKQCPVDEEWGLLDKRQLPHPQGDTSTPSPTEPQWDRAPVAEGTHPLNNTLYTDCLFLSHCPGITSK